MTIDQHCAEIHVTKLAAARRQLCSAIRQFFNREDELAIHTVAAAAYRILSDLKAQRGRDEVGDYYLTAIFYAVRDYRRGTLPGYLANDPETMRWVRDMADRMPITATSEFSDVMAHPSSAAARDFWQNRNRVANFLKHAKCDPRAYISLDDVDNLELLMLASCAYDDLTNDPLWPEGFVLWIYFNAVKGITEGMPNAVRIWASELERLYPNDQIEFCARFARLLREMTEASSANR